MKNIIEAIRPLTSCLGILLALFGLFSPAPVRAARGGGAAVALPPFVPLTPPVKTLQPVSPFNIIGFIQKATLDNAADPFSGGTITVNGITIVVPRNTLFQLPATSMTWHELFKLAPSQTAPALPCATNGFPCSTGPYGLSAAGGPQTGLALSDSPAPAMTYEVTVIGNRVVTGTTDQYVAALMFLSQQSLNSGQGYINSIDYAKGELWVSSSIGGQTGARIRINSPMGRYGLSQTPDQRFTADEDNPTVRAETGYPMCIPRFNPSTSTDSLCPEWNRPVDPVTGAYQTIYTMPPPPLVSPTPVTGGPMPPPDATQQAPFEVNDYVTYSGTLVNDGGTQYVSAHTIVASLGIFTAPGTMPAYVAVEDMLLGVAGDPNPLFPQEAVEKLRVTAMTTDSTQLVDFYAVDVDACGTQKNRFYGSADPFGPPLGGKKGRARLRATVGNFLPATREMRATTRSFIAAAPGQTVEGALSVSKTYANGLVAGQYHAPNYEFIFPENLLAGSPQVPLPLQEFPFLVNGSGPYFGAGSNNSPTSLGSLSQLSPWPGLSSPTPNACGAMGTVLTPPVANAGTSQTVNTGKMVFLDGSASADTNSPALPLSYTWVQATGPDVNLQDNGRVKSWFTAPPIPQGSTSAVLTFQLVVSNGFASSSIASTSVTISGPQSPVVNAGANQSVTSASQVHLQSSAVDPNGAAGLPLSFKWTQTGGTAVVFDKASSPTPSFTAPTMAPGQPAVTLSFRLDVTDGLGLNGSGTTNVTVKPIADTVQITAATYKVSGSRLSVSATSSVATGVPVLTLHVPTKADVVMTYDPTTRTYSVPQYIVNPIPGSISVTSSFGGSATSSLIIKVN